MTDLIVSISQSATLVALRAFLLTILPSGIEVVLGQDNRVPEPKSQNFVIMTPIMVQRLETNTDTFQDVAFTASIAGTELTVTDVDFGALSVGRQIFGVGVADSTRIIELGTGSGGVGTYVVSQSQTVSSEKMACGSQMLQQPVQLTVQLDIHGPGSADNAQVISTLFRDDYAVRAIAAINPGISPLYNGEPHQMPFTNDQDQVENRWVIDVHLQVNQSVTVPQQFADQLDVGLIEVDTAFPAA